MFTTTMCVIVIAISILVISLVYSLIEIKLEMNYAMTRWRNYRLVKLSFYEFLKFYNLKPWYYDEFRKCIVRSDDYVIHFNFINTVIYRIWNVYFRDRVLDNDYRWSFLDMMKDDFYEENDISYAVDHILSKNKRYYNMSY